MTWTTHRLKASLSHLPGVGPAAELKAWRLGVVSWDDMRRHARCLFSRRTADRVLAGIAESESALNRTDARFFLRRLPVADRVRLYPIIQHRVLFLDIETTGPDPRRDQLTTAVTYDGHRLRAFVRDQNLHELSPHVRKARALVTFNGHRFDLPVLRNNLGLRLPHIHLDLCTILRARHLRGGLKRLERQLCVARAYNGGAPVDGKSAPSLWARWQSGNHAALHQLLINAHDTLVLERLLIATLNLSMSGCPVFAPLPRRPQPHPTAQGLLHDSSLTS